MYILTGDRLIFVINPLKYKSRMTRKRMGKLIILCFVVSITLGTLAETIIPNTWTRYIIIGVSAVYVIFTLMTYFFIFVALRRSREQFEAAETNHRTVNRKQYLVPCLIILTFVCLYEIPYAIQNDSNENICILFQILGLLCDPVIYIFLSPHYRKVLTKICCKRQASNIAVQNNSHSIPREDILENDITTIRSMATSETTRSTTLYNLE